MKSTSAFCELPEGVDAAEAYRAVTRNEAAGRHVLYSSDAETRIGIGCAASVTVEGGAVRLVSEDGRVVTEIGRDPFEQVPRLLQKAASGSGWAAYGFVSFDIARHYLPYGRTPEVPELVMTIPQTEIRIRGRNVHIRSIDDAEAIKDLLESLLPRDKEEISPAHSPLVDHGLAPHYYEKVEKLTRAIKDGDLSKAILSRRVVFPGKLDVPATYQRASLVNSGVRSFALRTERVAGVGFSPEVLLESTPTRTVTTCLLAGTRRRGATLEEDRQLQAELFSSAKEVKEHAISVQLAQEEIRSVCAPDSIRIFEFMDVKKFRSVQHLGSKVSGSLRAGLTAWDALRVLFPAITVAGVPKAAALRWIGSLEEHPRGVYGGVVGFVESSGCMDLALAIRSAFEYGDKVHLNAGAGIVGESDPEFEYVESVNKMKMMLGQTVLEKPSELAVEPALVNAR